MNAKCWIPKRSLPAMRLPPQRDVSAVLQLPQTVTKRLRAQSGSTLVLGARNIHTWSSWTGIDPEANYGISQSETQSEFQTTGLPTYFTFRLNLKY